MSKQKVVRNDNYFKHIVEPFNLLDFGCCFKYDPYVIILARFHVCKNRFIIFFIGDCYTSALLHQDLGGTHIIMSLAQINQSEWIYKRSKRRV